MDSGPPQEPQGLAARTRAAAFGAPGTFDGAPVTRAIIWANVLVFVAEMAFVHTGEAFLTIPNDLMIAFGANLAPATIFDHRVETLLTSCFLHFSLLHVGFNMVALRQVGPFVERAVGPARFAAMYVVSGIFGSVASALFWFVRHTPYDAAPTSAGASGAVCGVIAAAMILGARTQGWRGPLAQGMARWLGTIFILGLVASFDNAAHTGGAVAGAAIAALWRRGVVRSATAQRTTIGLAASLCVAAGVVVVVRDMSDMFTPRYDRAIVALSANRCDDARSSIFALDRLPLPTPSERNAIERLHESMLRRCVAPREISED